MRSLKREESSSSPTMLREKARALVGTKGLRALMIPPVRSQLPGKAHQRETCSQKRAGAGFRHDIPFQRERLIERREWRPSHDILAHAKPVRIQHLIARPRLQVWINRSGAWPGDRPRCGEPIELSVVQSHLR